MFIVLIGAIFVLDEVDFVFGDNNYIFEVGVVDLN